MYSSLLLVKPFISWRASTAQARAVLMSAAAGCMHALHAWLAAAALLPALQA
jgi:hypothetical protein